MTEPTFNSGECSDEFSDAWLDDDLVDGIRQRNEEALTLLIDRYGGQVRALCLRICTDELEASGVVTEVFWQFWCQADRFEPTRGSICTYLLTMARSRAIDAQRSVNSFSRRRIQLMESVQHGVDAGVDCRPEAQLLRDEYTQQVQQALGQLPDLQRKLLQLAFFDGLSHTQMAALLQTPLGTVKTHIRKGLQSLRNLLTELSESGKRA